VELQFGLLGQVENMFKKILKNEYILVLFVAAAVSFSFQGSRGLYETSEGRYAECAREMVESGNYLEPQVGYRPHFTKPPITYWAIAGGLKVLGQNEWGVRIYNSFAFVLTVLAVTAIGAMLWGKKSGVLAGLVYATSPYPVFAAFSTTTDTLLTMWNVFVLLCYVKSRRCESVGQQRLWTAAMWLCAGFGVLTKGPMGCLFLPSIAIWHWLRGYRLRELFYLPGVILFAAVGLWWYVLIWVRHPGLARFMINEEILGRFTGHLETHKSNPEWYKPFMIYIPILFFGAGIWLGGLTEAIKRKRLAEMIRLTKRVKTHPNESFLFLVFSLPILVFFLAKARLLLYVLPLYSVVALAAARGLELAGELRNGFSKMVKIAAVSALVIIVGKGVLTYYPTSKDMRAVYSVCQSISGGTGSDTDVFAFQQKKLFGLQFYLDGKLKKVFLDEETAQLYNGRSLKDVFEQIKGQKRGKCYIFVCDREDFEELESRLSRADINFKVVEMRYWELCVVETNV